MFTKNGNILKINGHWLKPSGSPGPGPIPSLPPNTVRVRTNDGNVPNRDGETSYETATLVTGTNDVYDVYKSGTSFSYLFNQSTNVIEVLGANTTGITNMLCMFQYCINLTTVHLFNTSRVTRMDGMFKHCCSLTSIPLFDTSSVTIIAGMFQDCSSLITVPLFNTSKVTNTVSMFSYCSALTNVPLFDTSNVTDMRNMFDSCINVESGALELYHQASSQTTPPSKYTRAFCNCGSNTQTGAAELAQIPSDWK